MRRRFLRRDAGHRLRRRLAVGAEGGSGRRGVHVDRVRRHVRSDVIEDVGVAGDGHGADDDRDHDAETDGREGRAGAGPVASHVAQRQADGNGRLAADSRQQGEEERRDQDDPHDQRDESRHEPDHATAVPGRARDREHDEPDDQGDHARHERAVNLAGWRGTAGESADDWHTRDGPRRVAGGEESREHRQHHRRHDHVPGQRELRDDVVRALFVVRAVDQPEDEAEHEAQHGAHGADNDPVRLPGRAGHCGPSPPSTRASRGNACGAGPAR